MNDRIKILSSQKNRLAGLLLFVLVANLIIGGILLPTKMAKAQYQVQDLPGLWESASFNAWDKAWEGAKLAWEKVQTAYHAAGTWLTTTLGISKSIEDKIALALKWAFTAFKKKLLDMMADQIINWINGGGKPQFVTDWRSFLTKAADDVGGQFVSEYLGAKFLCQNISPQIQIMLARPKTFNTTAACTLSSIGTNIQNFYNNFASGGWKGWLTVSETQNNIYGMYLYAVDQKWAMEELAVKTNSTAAASAAGFLGDQVCLHAFKASPDGNPDDNIETTYSTQDAPKRGNLPSPLTDANCTEWFTRTPGKVAADTLSKVVGKDYDWLIQSKEYSEYIVAIADAVMNRVVKEGIVLITSPTASGSSSGSFIIDYSTVIPTAMGADIVDYQDAAESQPYVEQIIPQEKLLKENLKKIRTEYQTNLALLYSIRATQIEAFNTLQNMSQENCPSLPSGATLQVLGSQTIGNCGAACPCKETTIKTTKVTAPSFGEATFQETTIEEYPEATCSQVTTTKTTAVALGSLSTDAEISSIDNEISNIQMRIDSVDFAVADLEDYQKTITAYNAAYDAAQSHIGSRAGNLTVATSTIAAMYSAKLKAIDSIKITINSPSTRFKDLMSEVMAASQDTTIKNSDLIQKRGIDMSSLGCSYSTGYYKTQCDIQGVKSAWDAAYDSCLVAKAAAAELERQRLLNTGN